MTLSDFRSAVRFGILNRSATAVPDSTIDRAVNDTYRQVSMPSVYRHRALERTGSWTIAADDVDYAYSALSGLGTGETVWGLFDVTYIQGSSATDFSLNRYRLRPAEMRWLDRLGLLPQGPPRRYFVWQNVLYLDARPTSNEAGHLLQARCYVRPPKLTATSDKTVLDPEWDEPIVVGAQWRIWRSLNQMDIASELKVEYGDLVNEITRVHVLEGEDPGRTVSVRHEPYTKV